MKAKMYTEMKTGEKYSSRTAMKKHEKGESIQQRIKEYGKSSPKVTAKKAMAKPMAKKAKK
jgi:hypothetical protein